MRLPARVPIRVESSFLQRDPSTNACERGACSCEDTSHGAAPIGVGEAMATNPHNALVKMVFGQRERSTLPSRCEASATRAGTGHPRLGIGDI